ncbi:MULTISPECIES: hypothetical protein [Sphingobacterium]|uniref:Lipocalin-like domain-containing protein n=1 Tax=Sphingobacterium populi TaxID=1812824 RepID=A0ABW5UFQ4_9SPHI|nr:hypothetical protein [Sphingobacterium sp. CFCC 11742]
MKVRNLIARLRRSIARLLFRRDAVGSHDSSSRVEAKLIGKWRYVHSRSWVTTSEGPQLSTHYNTKNAVSIEFRKGNFSLKGDKLTYEGEIYTIQFYAGTLILAQDQYEETFVRSDN